MIKNILIIGYGNVGKAIAKIESEAGNKVFIAEKGDTPDNIYYDVCHITIPHSDNYVKTVSDYLREYTPTLTIIHTTILLDVLHKIKQITGLKIVHSPVESPNNSNEKIVYQDKRNKPTNIIGDYPDIKYSRLHLDDILSNKVEYSSYSNYSDNSYHVKKFPTKKVEPDIKYRKKTALEEINIKFTQPLKKIGRYW